MRKKEEIIRQLSRPPSVANWARHNFKRLDDTRKGILRFALSPPRHSLADIYSICEAIVVDRISRDQALKCIEGIKHPQTRRSAEEVIPAFFDYAVESKLDGLSTFKDFRVPYPIGRSESGSIMTIPVVPTFTILRNEKPTPVFLLAWSKLALTEYQKNLVSTIIRNAILTQQDFIESDAIMICTPRFKNTEHRLVTTWSIRDRASLSDDDLEEQFGRYTSALSDVLRSLSGE